MGVSAASPSGHYRTQLPSRLGRGQEPQGRKTAGKLEWYMSTKSTLAMRSECTGGPLRRNCPAASQQCCSAASEGVGRMEEKAWLNDRPYAGLISRFFLSTA
jgi:hypothetical protein